MAELCGQIVCQHGGMCSQTGTTWRCSCSEGWSGVYCDVPNISCQAIAAQRGDADFPLCCPVVIVCTDVFFSSVHA